MKNSEIYQQLTLEMDALRERRKQIGASMIQEGLREVFDTYPEVQSISWAQYTPYFNDGDECKFGVRNDEPDINEICGYEIPYTPETKHLVPAQELARSILQQIIEEDYKEMFGDHVRVTIKRDGEALIEEYDHD